MRTIKSIRKIQEADRTPRTVGAPRAQLYTGEGVAEQVKQFVREVMTRYYSQEHEGYVIGDQVVSRTEGTAMMFLVLAERGWINVGRTVRPFCEMLKECIAELGYPATVVPARNNVGSKIDDFMHPQEKGIIVSGVVGEKISNAHRRYYTFMHHFYTLLLQLA